MRYLIRHVLVVASCVASAAALGAPKPAAPAVLEVSDAWIRIPPPGTRTAAAYFSLKNSGKVAATVVDVRVISPDGGTQTAELHATRAVANGGMTMEKLASLPLAPGASSTFAPGGLHVMIFGVLPELKEGESQLKLVLKLADGSEITTPLAARAP